MPDPDVLEAPTNLTRAPVRRKLNIERRNEIARGYLLIGVFIVHVVMRAADMKHNPMGEPFTFAFLKLTRGQVEMFFILSGMSSRGIGKRSFHAVLQQALMLLILCWVSQVIGIFLTNSLFGGFGTGWMFIKQMVKPIILGMDWTSQVPWFFSTLALARVMSWLYERDKFRFLLAWIFLACVIAVTSRLHIPNFYEWKNWALGTLFFIIGMKLPKHWEVPRKWGLLALAGGLCLAWFNVPHILTTRPCLLCQLGFIANVQHGHWTDSSVGTLPVFIAEQLLLLVAILWAAQSPIAPIGQWAAFFGRFSMQVLLLEGWWIISADEFFWRHQPAHIGLSLLTTLAVLTTLGHGIALKLLEPWLTKTLMWCTQASKTLLSKRFWLDLPVVRQLRAFA